MNSRQLSFIPILVLFVLLPLHHPTAHHHLCVKSFAIVNYTNFIPVDPIFIVEVVYEFLGVEGFHHRHDDIVLSVGVGGKFDKFTIGENVLFRRLSRDRIRLFVPFSGRLTPGRSYFVSFSFSEGKKVVFRTNVSFFVSNVAQCPIFLSDGMEVIEVSEKHPREVEFFFVSQSQEKVKVVDLKKGITNTLLTQSVPRLKGVYSFSYLFLEEGEFLVEACGNQFKTMVVFDRTPPMFRIISPSNFSQFFRTNRIKVKWSDPIDSYGVCVERSSLVVRRGSKVVTNISPLVSLNRESVRNAYEVVYLSLEEGDYECVITYCDGEGNSTNVSINFKILPPSLDVEKPYFRRIVVEGSEKLLGNKFKVKGEVVGVFLEFSDGEFGSGVKRLYYEINGESLSEPVFDESKYLSVTKVGKETKVLFWLEDFGGNFSETNVITLVR